MHKILGLSLLLGLMTKPAFAICEARLKQAVPLCPAVAYSPEDCDPTEMTGKKGNQFYPNIINVMSSGSVYACASHETCIEIKYLDFRGCKFEFRNRSGDESPEYMSHFFLNLK